MSVYEKQLKFKPCIVSLFHGQHMEPWYVRLNPHGVHVPVLVHGDRVINDPNKIIDYVDKLSGMISCVMIFPHNLAILMIHTNFLFMYKKK